MIESSEDYSVPAMAYVLQSRTSTVGERIAALRSLKQHLEENRSIDSYNQKRIKQLILDSVLQMILSEERVTNIVKRQLVRTELFLILAKLLDSNALFGSILGHESNSSVASHAESVHEYNSEIDSVNSQFRPPPPHPMYPHNRPGLGRRIQQPPGGWVKQGGGSQVSQLTQFSASLGLSPNNHAHGNAHSPVSPLRHSSSTGRLHEVGFVDPRIQSHNHNSHFSQDHLSLSTFSRGESRGHSRGSRRVGPDLSLLKPLLQKHSRNNQQSSFQNKSLSSKILKPRPSVLHDRLVSDNFVPGADPTNYFEQDRKLGYQKPRMWFPGAVSATTANDLLPNARSATAKAPSAAELVVQEFLQMRSLASYVGDLVAPFAPVSGKDSYMNVKPNSPSRSKTPSSPGEKSTTSRFAGLTDQARFHEALREISDIWSPLLGMHLPPSNQQPPRPGTNNSVHSASGRKRKLDSFSHHPGSGSVVGGGGSVNGSVSTMHSQQSGLHSAQPSTQFRNPNRHNLPQNSHHTLYAEYAQEIVPFKCLRVGEAPAHKAQTRKHTLKEYEEQRQEAELLSKTVRPNVHPYASEYAQTKQYQSDVSNYLAVQKEHVLASVRASERLIQATMQSQYHLFKPKYLLLLEGNKANSRAVLAAAMVTFARVKRHNLLALGMGVWKILLVQMASVARRPLYARVAACHLMSRWQQEVHHKKLRSWIIRWRRRTGVLIFIQRTQSVIRIQTLYRTWRDRRKFIAMHLSRTFMGVLSDVYLGPKRRGLDFYVPDVIRNDRRLLWLAATIIQTVYRCYIASKQYYFKRRMIVLIQSIIRMFPKYKKYKRLKATTIKCQAWARRTVKRIQFKRLKAATIVVQKYTRRYLCTIHKLRSFEHIWRVSEQPLAAVIMIQCRYRIRLAKKKIKQKRFAIALRTYSALVIQRSYYRYKKAFHTFFLMCVLRVREVEDIKVIKKKTADGRYQAAVIIQNAYRDRYFKRNISAIIRVQCWFRGRMGYGLVDILRKERWASRKLRHWAKVKVNRRRKMARRIQKWWWGCKEGRLRAHLWYLFRQQDLQEDLENSEKRHFASMKIQAYVKGVWDRIWVRRHRAALIIQRNARICFALKRMRRWKKERIMKVVRRYALFVQEKGLKNITARILKKHSENMRKPQALGRGFIVRTIMKRARWVAFRMGMAAVKIQRRWRMYGVQSKALEIVRALRREKANPFKPLHSAHEVLLMMRQQTKTLYSTFDARVGMRVSSFLYRMGCLDLLEMFPRKHYNTVADMRTLNMYKMTDLYDTFKARPQDNKKGNKTPGSSSKVKKRTAVPTTLFESILAIVTPPLYTTHRPFREKIRTIQALPEYEVPYTASEGFKKTFQKKFGKNLNARADHMTHTLLQMIWGEYNNYKSIGLVYTKHQVLKAINAASDSNHPLSELEFVRARENGVVDERKYDRERINKTCNILQLCVDRLIPLLPPGKLRNMVERANSRIVTYKRKMQFIKQRLISGHATHSTHPTATATDKHHTTTAANDTNPAPAAEATAASTPGAAESESRGALDLTSHTVLHSALPITRSLDLPFTSTNVVDLEIECDISVCRVYFDVLDAMYMLTRAVQSLKNSWHNSTYRRAAANEKAKRLRNTLQDNYLVDRHTDKVKRTWLRSKRIETSRKKLDLIMKAVHLRKAQAKYALSFVPRHGWANAYDDNGYSYWYDTHTRNPGESSYDMPIYDLAQYYKAIKIQRAARQYNIRQYERKLLREAEARAEIERIQAQMEIERIKGLRQVKTTFTFVSRVVNGLSGHRFGLHKTHDHHHVGTSIPSVEQLLPWKYRFEENSVYKDGHWALLKLNNNNHTSHSHNDAHSNALVTTNPSAVIEHTFEPLHKQFDIVVIFRLKMDEQICDVRTIKGKTLRNIPLKRIFQMNLDVGMHVETRYKQELVFYKSVITHINTTTESEYLYDIRYEDGECATMLTRNAIRPSLQALRAFMNAREQALKVANIQHRRMVHFAQLKRQRVHHYHTTVQPFSSGENTTSEFLQLENSSVSRPESPMLLLENSDNAGEDPPEPVLALENNLDEGSEKMINDSGKEETESTALVVVPSTDERDISTPSVAAKPAKLVRITTNSKLRVSSAQTVVVPAAPVEPMFRLDIKIRFPYSRVCNRYGWSTYTDTSNTYNSNSKYYVNVFTEEVIYEQPVYTATEVQYTTRIQRAWLLYSAKCKVYRKVLHYKLTDLIQGTIKKCAKISYVGYELEGLTAMQMLRRAGYWELSEILEAYYKATRQSLSSLTIEHIAKIPKEQYESYGFTQPQHQKEIKEFQSWYNKTAVKDKQKRLSLFNYFKSPEDDRDINAVILSCEEVFVAKFMKYVKTGAARTRQSVQGILEASIFPHTHQQVDTYLKKYENKAELTREMVFELINKHTTHTYVEERVVLRHFTATAYVVCAILHVLKLRHLRSVVFKALKQCEKIMKGVELLQARPLCTGPEARAALLLRKNVFAYLLKYISSVEIIQRNVRAYLLSKSWNIYLIARMRSIAVLQRCMRRTLAFRVHRMLSMQRASEWEQLWDSRRNYLYYYNYVTGASQYNEPDEPFRPLVRHPLSAALIQAWPDLDNRQGVVALLPTTQGNTSVMVAVQHSHNLCGICNVRKCVRICNQCTDEVYYDNSKYCCFPYCFTCYMKAHPDDNAERAAHTYTVVDEVDTSSATNNYAAITDIDTENPNVVVPYNGTDANAVVNSVVLLQCCMCDNPATRKCLGLLDDADIEKICNKLLHTAPDGWVEILKQSNVGGDRKLTLLLDQIRSESSAVVSSVIAFQTTEAASAAANSPSKAKTAEPEHSPEAVLSPTTKTLSIHHLQAVRALLENSRAECDECYCSTCYAEVHSGGKRALHKWKGFQARAVVCSVCTNCPAEVNCFDCDSKFCSSCYKVFHSMGRKRNHKREKVLESLQEKGVYCGVCERRAADTPCENDRCHFSGCDSCMWFKHLPQCTRDVTVMGGSPSTRSKRTANSIDRPDSPGFDERPSSPESRVAPSNRADTDEDACVVCGEPADTRCVQCRDCYCSRVWMGNAGCFAQHHSKGNRASHTTERHIGKKELMMSMRKSKSMRGSRRALLSPGK